MAEHPDDLITVLDFTRWGASRFNAAGLYFGHGTDNAIDEAAQLVLGAVHLDPSVLGAVRDCRLTSAERVLVTELIDRRVEERVPVAYLTGRAWFAGLEFIVDREVLIPRSPIAELIEGGFEPWIDGEIVNSVLDLCCGSGCIGIAVAVHLPEVDVDLVDISAGAIDVARRNIERHGVQDRVRCFPSDLFEALQGQAYEVIVANPPYVARAEWEALPREYHNEPSLGLLGGDDGLDLAVRILADAAGHLTDEGILIMEVGNAAVELERRFPEVPFTWIDFERGGEGVLLLTREQLERHQPEFTEEALARWP